MGDGACDGTRGRYQDDKEEQVVVGVSVDVKKIVVGGAKAESTGKCPSAWG